MKFENKGAVPVQIAPLLFSQPRNQIESIYDDFWGVPNLSAPYAPGAAMLTCHHSHATTPHALKQEHGVWSTSYVLITHDCVCAHMTWLFKSHLWQMLLCNSFTCVHKQYVSYAHCKTHCNTLQRTLQHNATQCNTLWMAWLIQTKNDMTDSKREWYDLYREIDCIVRCNTLQHTSNGMTYSKKERLNSFREIGGN